MRPLLASAPHHRAESLFAYERTLLEEMAAQGSAVRLRTLGRSVLDRTREELIGDAVHCGWLHRLHHDQRTEAGEELARRTRAFQRDLRRLKAQGNAEAFAGELRPYAPHFGMAGQDTPALARFAHAFTATFTGLDGWHPPAPQGPDFGQPDEALNKPSIPGTAGGSIARDKAFSGRRGRNRRARRLPGEGPGVRCRAQSPQA